MGQRRKQKNGDGEVVCNKPAQDLDAMRVLASTLFPDMEDFPRIPQQLRSREKRREILNAALPLFIKRGYVATTADDIALAAGVSVGTFYNYFRNKRQALIAIALERLEDVFSSIQLTNMDFSTGNYRETIATAIQRTLLHTNTELRRVWQELMSQEPRLLPYQQLVRQHILTQLEQKIRVVTYQKKTWPDLDIEATSRAILILIDAVNLNEDPGVRRERMIDALTDMVYRTLFPPDGYQSVR
jgi:Transcriptional regulator